MTNKQERYFVVSNQELQFLITASMDAAHSYEDETDHELLNEAKAACRARPVPERATHFALFDEDHPYYTPDDHEAWVTKSWRIHK